MCFAARHGNSAVLVTMGPDGEFLDRGRVDLTRGLPTHPHHHEGSWAVGRYTNSPWARAITLAEAVALVGSAAAVQGCSVKSVHNRLACGHPRLRQFCCTALRRALRRPAAARLEHSGPRRAGYAGDRSCGHSCAPRRLLHSADHEGGSAFGLGAPGASFGASA